MDAETKWLHAYVEKCLRAGSDDAPVCVDDDGDFFYRWGTAACWVRIEQDPLTVKVFAHAATHVKRSAKLLGELNELNSRARHAKVFWAAGLVMVTQSILAEGLTPAALDQACTSVGSIAEDIGTLAAAFFDGRTPFPADAAATDAEEA
jgi:hypothetical protein